MEKHVFKFGAGSWAVIVPKAWVERNGINSESVMDMREDEVGNIVLSTKVEAVKDAELTLDGELSPGVAARWVGMYYRHGVKKLTVFAQEGTANKQFEHIQDLVTRFCPGFEIVSRAKREMVLEDFTDMKEVSIEKILLRMRSLINEELKEIGQGDKSSVKKLEDLVNRFFVLGIRYVNIVQGTDALKHLKVLQLLETISDQLYLLSENANVKNKNMFEKLADEFELCFKALDGDYKALESAAAIRENVLRLLSRAKASSLDAYLVAEASKNMVKIAEFALDVGSNALSGF